MKLITKLIHKLFGHKKVWKGTSGNYNVWTCPTCGATYTDELGWSDMKL